MNASEPQVRLPSWRTGARSTDASRLLRVAILLAAPALASLGFSSDSLAAPVAEEKNPATEPAPGDAPPTNTSTAPAKTPAPVTPPTGESKGKSPPTTGTAAPASRGEATSTSSPPAAASDSDEQPPTATSSAAERSFTGQLEPPKLLKKHSVPPFWIDRTYDTHRTRALTLPPVFIHREGTKGNPKKLFHADLSLTFGWYNAKKGRRRWLSPLGLFFGSFSERSTSWASGALLMGYKRTGEKFNFGQFPFVWWWGNKYVRNLVVLPFHYHQKAPDSYQGMSALFFWYGHRNLEDSDPRNDLRYFVGAPFFVRVNKGVKKLDLGIPLYLGGENKLKGLKHRTVFPFVHWQSREFGNRKELWTPFYIRRSDRARGRLTSVVPPFLSFRSETPERDLLSVTPLLWRSKNKLKGSMTWVVGPWISYADPQQRISALAPFWWSFKDRTKGVSTSLLLPLGVARKSADKTAVYTLLGGGVRSKKDGWGVTLPPLFTSIRQRPTGKSHQVITPFFWHLKDTKAADGKGSDRWILPPLAYRTRVGDKRRFGLPPLLTFTGREGDRAHQVITPLFWHFKRGKVHTFVVPPLYVQRRADGWAAGLPPLLFSARTKERRYTVIPPLLFGDVTNLKEQRRLTISPFFVRSKSPDSRTIGALGIAWDVRRKDERHSVLFPLYYRRQHGDRVLTLTPLGGGLKTSKGRTWAFGPVFSRRQGEVKTAGLMPFFIRDVRPAEGGGTAKHTVAFPFYIGRRTPGDDLDMVTPLFWRTRVGGEKPRKNLALVPFYFRQRQPDGVDVDAGLPFFFSRDKHRKTHTLVVGPGFHRKSRTALNAGIVPLYWWHDDEKLRRLVSLPLVYHTLNKQSGARTTVAVPFWFDFRRANGSRAWVAFPFAIGNKKLHNFTRFGIAAAGYVDIFRLAKNYRFTGVVPLAFRYQKCGFREGDDPKCAYTLYGSYPLFMYGSDGNGRVTHSALSLYYFDKDKRGTSFFTPIGGARVRPGEELIWYAGPVGRGVTRKHITTAAFPLFFHRKHRTKNKHTTLVAPPLFAAHRDGESRWFEAGLVFWQFRKPHKISTAILPPVFFLSESYAERRLHWLLPLYLRDNKMGEDKTFTSIFPFLYFQRRDGKHFDVVQFPLVWHIERGKNSGTVAAALWWDIRVRGTTTQVLPGIFFRRENRKKQELGVIGPGLGWWTRDNHKRTPAMHWRALFGIVGGGNQDGQRYFSFFGARIKLDPKAVWVPKGKERREVRRAKRAERRALKQAERRGQTPKKPATPKATATPTQPPKTPAAAPKKQAPSPTAQPPKAKIPSMGSAGAIHQPGSAQPGSAQPGSAQPGSAQPGSAQPSSAQPSSAQPSSAQPGSAQPGSAQPSSAQPGSAQPGSAQPGAFEP